MSSRLTYANAAGVLTDFVLECWHNAGEKVVEGRRITADEAALDFIVAWVCSVDEEGDEVVGRGSVDGLCRAYGLSWPVLGGWIRKDVERNRRYEQALADRGELRKERLLDGWWTTAKIAVPDEAATHGDVHKARESLAKAEGLYNDAAKVNVDTQITIVHKSE